MNQPLTPEQDLRKAYERYSTAGLRCRPDQPCHADVLLEIANA